MTSRIMWLLLVFSAQTFAANNLSADRPKEYKCYLQMVDNTELVHYLMSKQHNLQQLQQQLTGGSIYAKDGITKRPVERAVECVEAEKEFFTFKARQLDKETLK